MSTETRLLALEKRIKAVEDDLAAYKVTAASQFQTQSAASTAETALLASIDALTTTVTGHTAKFATVSLPSETQYYLSQSDITGLKKIIAQAAAIKADVDRKMNALIAAWKSFKAQQNI